VCTHGSCRCPSCSVDAYALCDAMQSEAQAELAAVRGVAASAAIDALSPQTGAALLSQLVACQRVG
jgi:hypothetical protein